MNNYLLSLINFLETDSLTNDTIQVIKINSDIVSNESVSNESVGLSFMVKFLIFIFCVFFVYFIFRLLMQKTKKHGSYISNEDMQKWKHERKEKRTITRVDFKEVSDNLTKSNSLWKKLSKETHEAKWLNSSEKKIKLASELNSLINKNKNNYKELKKLEERVDVELSN